jgi:hypothetical protein
VRGIPEKVRRRGKTAMFYEIEAALGEMGEPSEEFVYDVEHDLHRFADGEFAFSKEYLNEKRLREAGNIG